MLYGITTKVKETKRWISREFEEVLYLDNVYSDKQIIELAHAMINRFNDTLRTGEEARELISVYILNRTYIGDRYTYSNSYAQYQTMWNIVYRPEAYSKFKDLADDVLRLTFESLEKEYTSSFNKTRAKQELEDHIGLDYLTIQKYMNSLNDTFGISLDVIGDMLIGDFPEGKNASWYFFEYQEKWHKILEDDVKHEMKSEKDVSLDVIWELDKDRAPTFEAGEEMTIKISVKELDEMAEEEEARSLAELFD